MTRFAPVIVLFIRGCKLKNVKDMCFRAGNVFSEHISQVISVAKTVRRVCGLPQVHPHTISRPAALIRPGTSQV